MKFQVQDLYGHINDGLGTAKETESFTIDKKMRAIDLAFREILAIFQPEEYLKEVNLSFSEKKADVPEDYFLWKKLFSVGNPSDIFERVKIEDFDRGTSRKWIEKIIDGQRKIEISDATAAAILRYIYSPATLSAATDEIFLPFYFMRAIGLRAAKILLNSDREFQAAINLTIAEEDRAIKNAMAIDANQNQEARFARVKSIYETQRFF
jgi:hypothetical protein